MRQSLPRKEGKFASHCELRVPSAEVGASPTRWARVTLRRAWAGVWQRPLVCREQGLRVTDESAGHARS